MTIRIITAASGSRRSVNAALKSPDVIQVKTCCVMTRGFGLAAPSEPPDGDERHGERAGHRRAGHRPGRGLADSPAEAGVQQEAEERQERDQQQHQMRPRRETKHRHVSELMLMSSPFQLREHVRVERLAVAEQAR